MARVTKSGLELAFHQRSKQWCKYYTEAGNSKVKYFGKGNSVRDLKSYHAALRKYLDWCAERDVAAKAQQFADTIARVKQGELPVAVLGDHSDALSFIQDQKQKGRLGRDGHIITDYLDPDERDPDNDDDWLGNDDLPEDCFYGAPEVVRAARVREIEKDKDRRKDFAFRVEQLKQRQQEDAKPKKATIRDWSRTWLVGAQEQAAAGDIVGKTVVNMEQGIKTFLDHAEGLNCRYFGSEDAVDKLIKDYRSMILGKVAEWRAEVERLGAEGQPVPRILGVGYSPNTANTKLKWEKCFLRWCYEHKALKVLPRALDSCTRRLHVDRQGYPLELKVVRKLWNAATDERMKVWICLGLNCGFKGGDITSLTGSMIKGDRLQGIRHKTKKDSVPMNFKLWPITQELLAKTRETTGANQLLYKNTKGEPYEASNFSNLFATVRNRAGVVACFEQLRDTSADWIEKAILSDGRLDGGLKQVFLAHKDGSTAKYYTSNNPAAIKVPELDKLIDQLDHYYKLQLYPSKTPGPA